MCILRDGNWKKAVVCAGGRMSRDHWADSVLFVGVCMCLWCGGWAGGHNQASNVALTANISNPHLLQSFALL